MTHLLIDAITHIRVSYITTGLRLESVPAVVKKASIFDRLGVFMGIVLSLHFYQ